MEGMKGLATNVVPKKRIYTETMAALAAISAVHVCVCSCGGV